jgi:hypothetical protein
MKTTSVTIMNSVRGFRAGLSGIALVAFVSLGGAQNAQAEGASHVNTQTAEVETLLTAVHDVTSYNGNPQTAIDHLATWYELWAEDATLDVYATDDHTLTTHKEGREAVIAFFAANPLFKANFVGLTPSFRTKISVHGDTADVYLECIFLTPALTDGPQRSLSGTARKVDGKWLFWRMANKPAQPLFP